MSNPKFSYYCLCTDPENLQIGDYVHTSNVRVPSLVTFGEVVSKDYASAITSVELVQVGGKFKDTLLFDEDLEDPGSLNLIPKDFPLETVGDRIRSPLVTNLESGKNYWVFYGSILKLIRVLSYKSSTGVGNEIILNIWSYQDSCDSELRLHKDSEILFYDFEGDISIFTSTYRTQENHFQKGDVILFVGKQGSSEFSGSYTIQFFSDDEEFKDLRRAWITSNSVKSGRWMNLRIEDWKVVDE